MKESRQSRRYRLRQEAFKDLSEKFPGEPRKVRRSMALDLSKKRYKSRGVA